LVLTELLQNLRNPILDTINLAFTAMGSDVFFIAVLCLIFWCINKDLAYKIIFTYIISGIAVQTLKITFRIPRPWITDSDIEPISLAKETATGYSFPSGHTQSGTALFSTLAINSRKKVWKIICFIIIFLIAFSRMYLGVHTIYDVLASFVLTLIISCVINWVMNIYKLDGSHRKLVVLIIILLIAAMVAYSMILYYDNIVEADYVKDCLKTAGAAFGFTTGWYIEKNYIKFSVKTYGLWSQIIKYLFGIIITFALWEGLKFAFSYFQVMFFAGDFIRYFILTFWIICLYPMLIKKLFRVNYSIF
jgi:hypothetical protein